MSKECPICGKPIRKSVRQHIRMAHPEKGIEDEKVVAEITPPTPEEKDTNEVDIGDIVKQAEPIIVSSVNKVLAEMNLANIIDKAVGERVALAEQNLSKQIDGVTTTITQAQQGNTAPANNGEQPKGNQLQDTILALLAQKLIGGVGGEGPSDFTKFLKTMTEFQTASALLYQGPRAQAQKEIIDMMKAGYSVGLDTKQVIKGAEEAFEKSKPTEPD